MKWPEKKGIENIIEEGCKNWGYRKNVSPSNFEMYKKDILSSGGRKVLDLCQSWRDEKVKELTDVGKLREVYMNVKINPSTGTRLMVDIILALAEYNRKIMEDK